MHRYFFATLMFVGVVGFGAVASANHAWGGYHWARTANPFTLKLGDSLSPSWDPYLATTISDWSLSSVLDLVSTAGANTRSQKLCWPVLGRGEVCNAKYGANGWLGIASIWVSGSHITQGTVKLNDTYFNTAAYNKPAWKHLVTCQEVGHLLGLDHQDTNLTNPNLNTCMDYTNSPDSNQHPNQHDYDMLETIYAHLDTTTTLSQSTQNKFQAPQADFNDPKQWGREVRRSSDGRVSLYIRDFGQGNQVLTHVFWAEEGQSHER